MLREWLARQDPEKVRRFFYLLQGVGGTILFGAFVWLRSGRRSESAFREGGREWQKPRPAGRASARPPRGPALLEGIRIDGPPHEVLGIEADASAERVQEAYRELMKRYHPDKLGPQGSPPWKEGQRLARAINQARDRMLKRG